jgi:hypothetical protein
VDRREGSGASARRGVACFRHAKAVFLVGCEAESMAALFSRVGVPVEASDAHQGHSFGGAMRPAGPRDLRLCQCRRETVPRKRGHRQGEDKCEYSPHLGRLACEWAFNRTNDKNPVLSQIAAGCNLSAAVWDNTAKNLLASAVKRTSPW